MRSVGSQLVRRQFPGFFRLWQGLGNLVCLPLPFLLVRGAGGRGSRAGGADLRDAFVRGRQFRAEHARVPERILKIIDKRCRCEQSQNRQPKALQTARLQEVKPFPIRGNWTLTPRIEWVQSILVTVRGCARFLAIEFRAFPDQPQVSALAPLQAEGGVVRNSKALAVDAGGQSGQALEEPTEEGRVLISHLPADLIHCRLCPLQAAFGILDAQALDIGNGAQAGGSGEASLEGPFAEPSTPPHFFDGIAYREVRGDPFLCCQDGKIPMVFPPFEDDEGVQPLLVPLKREEPRTRLSRRRTGVAGDEIEHQIVPGHGGTGRDELFMTAGNDQHPLGIDFYLGKGCRKGGGITEMHRCLRTIKKAGLRKEKNAGTGRTEQS